MKLQRKTKRVTFRSKLEQNIARKLGMEGIEFGYESDSVSFVQPAKNRRYTPDFWLPNGVILEAKGLLSKEDRDKHLWIKEQHPNLDIRFVFQNPSLKLHKGAKTTYAQWATKNGFKWCKAPNIPESWLMTS